MVLLLEGKNNLHTVHLGGCYTSHLVMNRVGWGVGGTEGGGGLEVF